jgi:hypothetical protein
MSTRLASLVLVVLLAIMLPAAGAPLDPNGTFVDDDGIVFEPEIEAIAEAGITRGCNPPSNDAYCPDSAVTRAQMASFLVRSLAHAGPVTPSVVDAFADDTGSIHEQDINTIAGLGIARGCSAPGLASPTTELVEGDPMPDAVALLSDLQVERHAGFDRVTFTFENEVPAWRVAYGSFPVTEDPTGDVIPLEGDNFVSVVLTPASGFDLSGPTFRDTYPGPDRLTVQLPAVREVVVAGDFEALVGFAIGVNDAPGYEVTALDDPARLQVDIDHPSWYCPNDPVTRGQMAAFLTRAFGFADTDPGDRFVDDDTSIFESEIEAIAGEGVTFGCNPPDNDRFCPDAPVTRAQMAAFLARALGLTPLPPPAVDDAALVRPVFLLDQPAGGPFLGTAARYVEAGDDTPETAVRALLDGPSAAETAMVPAFTTAVPAGTELLELDIAGGTATVDLSGGFDDGGGSATMFGRLAQVTFTLTAFPTIDTVVLELDGVAVTVFSSEGIDITGGLDPAYFFDVGVIPEVFPEAPAAFEFVADPFEVGGWSRAFEATINWELYDRDGSLLADGFETTGAAGPEFGVMAFDVDYTVASRQVGSLVVFEISAADGSRNNLREVPIWLEP